MGFDLYCCKNSTQKYRIKGKSVAKTLQLSAQFVRLKVTADLEEIESHSESVHDPGGPEGAVIAPELTEKTAYEYAQAYSGIP